MASGGDVVLEQSRKNLAVSAFCNHFSLDPNSFLVDVAGTDIRSLCFKILQLAGKKVNTEKNDEVMKWIAYADSFPFDFDSCFEALNKLNEELCSKSVLLGGLSPCEADVVVFSVIHSFVIQLPNSDWNKYPHVLRWMEWIQNQERFGKLFKKIEIEKSEVDVGVLKCLKEIKPKAEVDSNVKANGQNTKKATDLAADTNVKTTNNKITGDNQAAAEKMKLPNKGSAEKEKEVSISLLNIRVGLIHKAWKHPSADSLLVEEIDVGDAKMRQVVSGLAKYCTPEQLTNRPVVLITNVKPGKLRDVMSEGLVLCASNLDHTVVEPLLPPEGAKLGEAISFFGNEGKPEEVLNPKKKQLEKITPHLYTDDKGVATYKGIPFMTTSGPCTSSIPNASIK